MSNIKLKNYLHLHFIIFIWGFTAVLGALISIDAIPLVWYRMLLAVIIIFFYFIFKKKSFKVDRKGLLNFLLTGVIIALHWIEFFSAIKVANVSVALVMMSTGALFASFLEPIFFKRKLNPIELIFGLVVVVGLYIIFNVEGNYYLGIIYALIAAFLSAVFSVLNGIYIKTYEAVTISFYQLLFGTLFITIYLLFNNSFNFDFFILKTSDWVYLFILSSFCTAYAFIASTHVMKHISPYTVMLTINLEPVYGIILAVIIFGEKEKMNPQFYLGALIIILIVIANGIIKIKKRKNINKT